MSSILPVPTGRTSDMLLQQRLLAQLQNDQRQLLKIQNQLSTGQRIVVPSDDLFAATRAMSLQRLLQQKQQSSENLKAADATLAATETALASVANLITDMRAVGLGAVDSTSTDLQRQAMAENVRRGIEQLVTIGNHNYRGRQLFAGAGAVGRPFELLGTAVAFRGDDRLLQTFADFDSLIATNVSAHEVFGAFSPSAEPADLNPVLDATTRVADLRRGLGLPLGSIVVSDGSSSRTIDLSGAKTVGDVIRLIEQHPPQNRTLTASIQGHRLQVEMLDAGDANLSIKDLGAGSTAAELGIALSSEAGATSVLGADLDPALRPTTPLSQVLGGQLDASGLVIVNGNKTYTVDFAGAKTVEDLLNAIHASGANVVAEIDPQRQGIMIRSRLSGSDFSIGENGGLTASQLGVRTLSDATRLDELNYGRGVSRVEGTDFVVRRNDGTELHIDVSSAVTIADLLNAINHHPDNSGPQAVVARLAEFGNAIELVDDNPNGLGSLSVSGSGTSRAAWDLGLIPPDQAQATADPDHPERLTGRDPNPQETQGTFNSLLRLHQAILDGDDDGIERALEMLDADFNRLVFARADIGFRQQSIELIRQRHESETIELRNSLSQELEVDVAEAVAELTARQASFEASLRLIARTYQLSLIHFL